MAKQLLLTPDIYRHQIVESGSRRTDQMLFEFSTVTVDGFLQERIWRHFKVQPKEYIAWVEGHCPSAVWYYDREKISLVIPEASEAMEYKLRWV